jgi:hypothetical protein
LTELNHTHSGSIFSSNSSGDKNLGPSWAVFKHQKKGREEKQKNLQKGLGSQVPALDQQVTSSLGVQIFLLK